LPYYHLLSFPINNLTPKTNKTTIPINESAFLQYNITFSQNVGFGGSGHGGQLQRKTAFIFFW
jgi:hypothetical protein